MSEAKLVLVTGGCRSGKSSFAEEIAKSFSNKRTYIATAPVLDDEMKKRVKLHREDRANDNWVTIEEQVDLISAIKSAKANGSQVVLVDCLTLWINNLLYHAELKSEEFDELAMSKIVTKFLEEVKKIEIDLVLVINEVGFGVVPENKVARNFRDCSGRTAQLIAKQATDVYFLVAGISQKIK